MWGVSSNSTCVQALCSGLPFRRLVKPHVTSKEEQILFREPALFVAAARRVWSIIVSLLVSAMKVVPEIELDFDKKT